ncbi:MAG TPA: hypothetical protein VNE16_15040 [Vicinamibacterales bacterium]|nr:hypothetical protein [Vicinamibacterales bacterium]
MNGLWIYQLPLLEEFSVRPEALREEWAMLETVMHTPPPPHVVGVPPLH